jgi:hypothetical protein
MIALSTQLALAALTLALQAGAAPQSEPLETGKSLYQQARFPEAIETLRKAVERMEGDASDEQRRRRLVDAYRYLGLAYFALGEREIARDAFKNVLSLDPSERLDPELYAPKVVELFEQARLLAVPLDQAPRETTVARTKNRSERPPIWPKFAVEAWGGVDTFPDVNAPSPGFLARQKAAGFDLNEIALGGSGGQLGGGRFSLRLGSGRDRLSFAFEPLIRTGSRWNSGRLGADYSGQDYRFEHRWDVTVYEMRLTWSHQAIVTDAWAGWVDVSYRTASVAYERYNLLTPEPQQPSFRGSDGVDNVNVTLNGLRTALTLSRKLSRRLSIEGSLGYTLALRNLTYDPAIVDTPAGYEFYGSFDTAVSARLALSSQLDCALLYRHQSYGWTYLGELRSSSYLAALTIHTSR